MSTTIRVTGEHPSTITVGHGLGFEPIREALDEAATKVLIIHARPLASRAGALAQYLRGQGIDASTVDHPDAEAGKSIEVVASLWDECGRLQLGRKDAIVAMGGGATTDMAGFVAATWLRGITLVNVPTTLLAMVDAAVGGKTGINTSVGKNLVGSFYPATSVVADMDLLESLPTPDLAAGVAEIIKCGFIADPEILRIVEETEPSKLLRSNSPQLAEITTRAIGVKARVVSADLTEGGLREILNYGHTLAHAIERANDYTWRHGDAVAVGCCFAARLAQARGCSPPTRLLATTSFSHASDYPSAMREAASTSSRTSCSPTRKYGAESYVSSSLTASRTRGRSPSILRSCLPPPRRSAFAHESHRLDRSHRLWQNHRWTRALPPPRTASLRSGRGRRSTPRRTHA